jgi:hypothetical protein
MICHVPDTRYAASIRPEKTEIGARFQTGDSIAARIFV